MKLKSINKFILGLICCLAFAGSCSEVEVYMDFTTSDETIRLFNSSTLGSDELRGQLCYFRQSESSPIDHCLPALIRLFNRGDNRFTYRHTYKLSELPTDDFSGLAAYSFRFMGRNNCLIPIRFILREVDGKSQLYFSGTNLEAYCPDDGPQAGANTYNELRDSSGPEHLPGSSMSPLNGSNVMSK